MGEGRVRCHYVKNVESQLYVSSNEDIAYASLLTFHGDNIEESYKQDIVTNIEFESILPSIKKYYFHHHMVDFCE